LNNLLSTAAQRFYFRHPWQLILAIMGIALGVAVYVGVSLANDSARRAFDWSSQLVLGRTTHQLVNAGGMLPESIYYDLRTRGVIPNAAPIIDEELRLTSQPGRRFTLLGVDPLKETLFRSTTRSIPGESASPTALMVEPASVIVPESLANELKLENGSALNVIAKGRTARVIVAGTLKDVGLDSSGSSGLILADISTSQELLNLEGFISRIDLVLTPTEVENLQLLKPAGTTLLTATSGNAAFNELSRAFRINLTALSLLALMVGVFLIYATMSFSIVQRRPTIGVLRALGVQRHELLLNVLREATVLGLIATLAGLALGHQLGQGLVELVLRTLGDLYFGSYVTAISPAIDIYWKGALLGLGATLLAALAPAITAANTIPAVAMSRAALERGAKEKSLLAALVALPTTAIASMVLLLGPENLIAAFVGLFFVLVTGALLTPLATVGLMKFAEPFVEKVFGISGSLAVRGVTSSLSRTGVAMAALTVAIATVIGVGIMIASFRVSLVNWLDDTLIADLYLQSDVQVEERGPFTEARLLAIQDLPSVEGLSLSRLRRLQTPDGELNLRAMSPGPNGWGLSFVTGNAEEAISMLESQQGVLVSEPFAFRRAVTKGDLLNLPTPNGMQTFTILGVIRDYYTDGGSVTISLDTYRHYWEDNGLTGVGIYFAASTPNRNIQPAVESIMGNGTRFRLLSNGTIKTRSLIIFDRTFQITEVLRVLASLVAFLGILNALTSLQLERAREIATLRALGASPRQVSALGFVQTGLLGLAAGLVAIPLGTALAALLVFVINERSFGWSMDFVTQAKPMLLGVALAVAAALLAGLYPAIRAGRLNIITHLREE